MTSDTIHIRGSASLRGVVRPLGDKSIALRNLIVLSLAEGASELSFVPDSTDVRATISALERLGVRIERREGHGVRVNGVGLRGFRMPTEAIDCGAAGTLMRMLAGVLSAQHFGSRLDGDATLRRRSMSTLIAPLRARGAHISGTARFESQELFAPLSIAPLVESESLAGIDFRAEIPSAQVKSSLLLSGLYANAPTVIAEPLMTRDHTERLLLELGVRVESVGTMTCLTPSARPLQSRDASLPADASSTAALIAAAVVTRGSQVAIDDALVNPTRTGFLDTLMRCGANVIHEPRGDLAGEPVARIEVSSSRGIRAMRVGGEQATRMIDEIPVAAAVAAFASGESMFRDADALRGKESDRIESTAAVLRAFGVGVKELADGLVVVPPERIAGADVTLPPDHRIAMAACVLALGAEGPSVLRGASCVEKSYPELFRDLRALGAQIE